MDADRRRAVWAHQGATRFWESNAGAGPRGTPTLAGNRVYALGATGIPNALDAASGMPRWHLATGSSSYSSPHLVSIDGVPQLLLLNGQGASAVEPATGKLLCKHEWSDAAILQPALSPAGGC